MKQPVEPGDTIVTSVEGARLEVLAVRYDETWRAWMMTVRGARHTWDQWYCVGDRVEPRGGWGMVAR